MPQVLKPEIRETILKSALNQFYLKGFRAATMNSIAEDADIPAGLIYSYFKNKEDLFAQVVNPVIKLFKESVLEEPSKYSLRNLYDNELPVFLECIQHYNREIVVLVDKSEGSRMEKMKADIISDVTEHLKQTPFLAGTDFDDIFYHILATNFMEGIFELARHYRGKKWAEKMMNLLIKQHLYGSTSLTSE